MKRNRIVGIIVSMVMMLSLLPIVASAESGTYGNLKYIVYNNDYVEITGFNGEPTEIEIPTEIDELPVTSIGNYAFSDCTSLEHINISKNITNIRLLPFNGCSSLTSIDVDKDNSKYSSVNGVLFDKEQTSLILYPTGNSRTEYTVPNGVINIEHHAFNHCNSLSSVIVSNSVKNISFDVFIGCNQLKNVILPDNVVNIGSNVFYDTAIYENPNNWYNGALYVGNYIVATDSSSISGEYSVKNGTLGIAGGAFDSCDNLIGFDMKDSLVFIGAQAFWNCRNLEYVIIPDTFKTLGGIDFQHSHLSDVYYAGTKEQWNNIDYIKDYQCFTNATMHYSSTGTDRPKITEINIVPNSDNTGKMAEIQLDTVEYDSTLIVCFSNDNMHIDNKIIDISAGDTSKIIEVPNNISNDTSRNITKSNNINNVKVFIWNSLEGMRPLCEAKSKSIE